MQKIHLGLIGCGFIALKHIEAINMYENIIIEGVCDTDEKKLDNFMTSYEVPFSTTNYNELLQNDKIEGVIICTPSGYHTEILKKALEYNKWVLCEKPVATTKKDINSLQELIKDKKHHKVGVIFQHRLKPIVEVIKSFSEKFGELYSISANCFRYRSQTYYNDGYHGKKDIDGGVLMNQGIHFLDMIYYISGSKFKNIQHMKKTLAHEMECEDIITMNFELDIGTVGNLQANTLTYPNNFEGSIVLFYENATIKIGGNAMDKIEYLGMEERLKQEFLDNIFMREKHRSYEGQFKGHYHVYEHLQYLVQGKEHGLVSLNDAVYISDIIANIYNT